MDSRCFLLIFTAIFLYFSTTIKAEAAAEAPMASSITASKLVKRFCEQTNSYSFCMKVMRLRPQKLSSNNMRTVANFALAVARKQSIITRNFFNRIASVSLLENAASKAAFLECANYFNETVSMLNLKGLEVGEASLDVHYALDNAEYCDAALDSARVRNPLIVGRIRSWKKYFSVAYTSVVIIEDQTPSNR